MEAACTYLRQNATQEFIGETRDTSQPTISRYIAVLVPLVKSVLEEFVPDAAEAIEMVRGRVVLVDGTLTPCWSYEEHQELWNKKHKATGFNAQLISLLDGTAIWISGPLPGKTHDAKAFEETGAADIVKRSGGGFGTTAPDRRHQSGQQGRGWACAADRRAVIAGTRVPVSVILDCLAAGMAAEEIVADPAVSIAGVRAAAAYGAALARGELLPLPLSR